MGETAMDINGAVVFVTGASSGIGAATARAASRAGASVVLAARREERIRQLAGDLGQALPVRCDVTDPGQVEAAVRAAADAFGRIDVLVNVAGQEAASQLESSHAPQPQEPEQVAGAILALIKTGAEQADLVPEQFGGSFTG
jgi:NADP-dependent 3-hydroxy acid dehydrogenase YdfG